MAFCNTPAARAPAAPARPRLSRLGWHVVWILIVKVAVLYALWLAFVQPRRVTVDVQRMQQHLTGSAVPPSQEHSQ